LNAIEEDNDFSEVAEEVDIESEEDSHGATDEKPRELYKIRLRLGISHRCIVDSIIITW
jgi:hypothetical protein